MFTYTRDMHFLTEELEDIRELNLVLELGIGTSILLRICQLSDRCLIHRNGVRKGRGPVENDVQHNCFGSSERRTDSIYYVRQCYPFITHIARGTNPTVLA